MGKVRIKTIGDEETEKQQKEEQRKKKETRLAESRQAKSSAAKAKEDRKTAKAPGMHGGERVVAVGPSEEELARIDVSKVEEVSEVSKEETKEKPKVKKAKFTKEKKSPRSKRYQEQKKLIDKNKSYSLSEALDLLDKLKAGKFDETVELHINMLEKGVSANVTLPHGTGKKTKVAIADDALIAEIEKGKINFDILVADPSLMPKLAKVARILGPKGLMPNPKNGTITQKPQELVKKYEGGQISFKTEAKAPIIHVIVGKVSFGNKKLTDNIETILKTLKKDQIQKAVLSSTMSPGIKLAL